MMPNRFASRLARGAALFALLTAAVAAADVPVVDNPAEPAGGVVEMPLHELWRVGGEDDDVFFGNVGSVDVDDEGNLYLLDSQLCVTHVYSPGGELLRTLGGEGDGPGEVRSPNGMFRASDGNVCVIQGFPGKIVEIAPDGTPAGSTTHSRAGDAGGQFMALISGMAHGDGMILLGIRMTMSGAGQSDNIYFLDVCDRQGKSLATLYENTVKLNFAALIMDEGASDFPFGRVSRADDGTIYAALPRNAYEISVFTPEGKSAKMIRRPYTPLPRTGEEKTIARRIQEAIGANYPMPPQEIRIEETQPDISRLTALSDGTLWVQTGRGDREAPDGCWVVLDEFDPAGRFARQIALRGEHDATRDGLIPLRDGRVLVVVGSLDAWLNQMGSVPDDETGAESEPLEVICYRLGDR